MQQMKEEGDAVRRSLGLELVRYVVQKFWILKKPLQQEVLSQQDFHGFIYQNVLKQQNKDGL